jgi:hypothetical protein
LHVDIAKGFDGFCDAPEERGNITLALPSGIPL